MKRRTRRKIKNVILKTITGIAIIVSILTMCMLDSQSNIPFYLCLICLAWLGIFAYANKDYKLN